LAGYDYGQPGAYFVTMVAAGRRCLFGEVANQEMNLGDFGRIVEQQWARLPRRFPNLELGAFVVMPNHVHGILIIHGRRGTAGNLVDSDDASYRRAPTEGFGKPVPGSIPTIIRSCKSAVAYRVHAAGKMIGLPIWQRSYYEHVIRNQDDWERVHRYIESNPVLWAQDEENPFVHR
jgi:REP element-mobilizing transposase RayT